MTWHLVNFHSKLFLFKFRSEILKEVALQMSDESVCSEANYHLPFSKNWRISKWEKLVRRIVRLFLYLAVSSGYKWHWHSFELNDYWNEAEEYTDDVKSNTTRLFNKNPLHPITLCNARAQLLPLLWRELKYETTVGKFFNCSPL